MTTAALPAELELSLGKFLGRQRWYAGSDHPLPDAVAVVSSRLSWSSEDASQRMWSVIVAAEGSRYHVLIGERLRGEPAEFLSGRDDAVIGVAGSSYFYDATVDPELGLRLLEVVSGGEQQADWVRHVSVEQSNTSLVYDDRIILKVFRRLPEGPNPDILVTESLAASGFAHVATPVASWREGGVDLAFAQQFLAGGSEGWALALTSLRDFYTGHTEDPAEAGGDFAGEAARLGTMTARMHLAMADAFGVFAERLAQGAYPALIEDIARRLDAFTETGPGDDVVALIGPGLERLRAVADPGPSQRVHGDYHLGQVMRTDTGWYVLDFEGEPARSAEERLAPASPAKDVAGMLRSFHYAARFALRERDNSDGSLDPRSRAWEGHNRSAFMDGYAGVEGIASLLPAPSASPTVLAAYELDKALYELDYERAYRPSWADIPTAALGRLLGEIAEQGSPSGA